MKEDFTYSFYNNYDFSTPPPTDREQFFTPPQTDRSQRITSRTETPQKLQKFLRNSHLFNEVLED